MKTTIYMMRHGESAANVQDMFLGHGNMDLTETGHAQAARTAEYLKTIHCDAIYASDLDRAFHTAEHTAHALGLPITRDPQLREIEAGEWDLKTFSELCERYPTEYHRWVNDIGNAGCVGGESVIQLQRRIVAAVTRIAAVHAGQTVFLFSHATPIRVMAAYCLGKSADTMKEVPWASNASVSRFAYEDGHFTLEDYSYDAFMGDLVTKLPANV